MKKAQAASKSNQRFKRDVKDKEREAHKMRKDGVKIPTYASRDVAYGFVGKIVSRVLLAYAISSLPEDIAASQVVLQALWERQKAVIDALKGEDF